MMRTLPRSRNFKLMLAAGLLSIIPYTQAAWMDDFYNSAGASANVTGSSVYQTQGRGVISGGGLSYRVPQANTNLFGFTPPGYKAGCGGIDLWAGSFSFINKDAFVAMLRNIGQNATGYFFQIALKTMAPDIDATLTELNQMVQKINQNNINSCKAGEMVAQGAADLIGGSLAQTADKMGANVLGTSTDYADAQNTNSTSPSNVQSTLNAAKSSNPNLFNDAGGTPVIPTGPFNVLYNALSGNNTLFGGNSMPPDEIDLMISLLGTTVITPSTDPTVAVGIVPIKPSITWDAFIGDQGPGAPPDTSMCGGGTAPGSTDANGNPINDTSVCMRVCSAATGSAPAGEKCIYASDTDGLQLQSFTGFSEMTKNSLNNIKMAIVNRTTLTDQNALALINMSSIPIYSLLSTTTTLDAMSGAGSTFLTDEAIDVYADVIATELAYRFVQHAMMTVDRLQKSFVVKVDKNQKALLSQTMNTAKQVLAEAQTRYAEEQRTTASRAANVNAAIQFAETLQKGMTGQLQASLKFHPS
jgi:conjugative transfer pilus assembly protein TraH